MTFKDVYVFDSSSILYKCVGDPNWYDVKFCFFFSSHRWLWHMTDTYTTSKWNSLLDKKPTHTHAHLEFRYEGWFISVFYKEVDREI